MQGWYTQGRRQLADDSWGDTVRFPVCNGYWERLIDARAVARNDGDKAGIKYGMSYKGQGWVPPGQTFESNDRVYIVEGIFHAIALHLAGYKAIAAISCNSRCSRRDRAPYHSPKRTITALPSTLRRSALARRLATSARR